MSARYAVGVGASGDGAAERVDEAIATLASAVVVVGRSRSFANPAWGGATRAPFVNACVVVQTPWPAPTLMAMLHGIERRAGRVRGQKNIARTLDLDLLWSAGLPTHAPRIPHPRLTERAFALIPLVEALGDAGVVVPLALSTAAARLGLASPMTPLSGALRALRPA